MTRIIMRSFVFSLIIFCAPLLANGQEPGTPLAQQYTDVVMKAGLYNGYRAIRQERINLFWKNIQDTLAAERRKLNEANAKLITVEQEVLKSKVTASEQQPDQQQPGDGQINFFGSGLDRSTYNLIMWGLAAGLALGLVISITRARSAVREARYRSELYEELTEEFRQHKVKANEKEIRLARELQTERNKVDELMGR